MKKKPDNNVPLNFSAKDHDAKVEQSKLTEEEARLKPRQRQLKKRVQAVWQSWIKRLKSKPRKPVDVIQANYQLQTLIGDFANEAKACGLEDWHNFSMEMIESKIATLVSTSITEKNEVVMHVPAHPTMLDDDNDRIVREQLVRDARPVQFRTLDELKAIPFVASAMGKAGYVGLLLHGKALLAFYKDGDTVTVGYLQNGIGIDKLPTLEEFQAAVNNPAEEKEKE